ncbi:inner membrane protein [Shewanella putrefaciens]|nr:inner membrane protein [Shewanella putrefaciens]
MFFREGHYQLMVLKRGFFLLLGLTALALGLLGIVLPLLPTVPFILLAAFCFARSSERLHMWLMAHPWFADALTQWQQQGAIRKGLKRKAMLISALSFSISIMLVPIMWVKGMLIAMALILLWYLKSIPEVE